jgi:hypothetical protein
MQHIRGETVYQRWTVLKLGKSLVKINKLGAEKINIYFCELLRKSQNQLPMRPQSIFVNTLISESKTIMKFEHAHGNGACCDVLRFLNTFLASPVGIVTHQRENCTRNLFLHGKYVHQYQG